MNETIEGIDIQRQGELVVLCIRKTDGTRSVNMANPEQLKDTFLGWFWNQIQVEGQKGSFEKSGQWR